MSKDVTDGKYAGELTPEEVIEQFEYRASIHLTYAKLLEEGHNEYLPYGTIEWHNWAINGYEWGIFYLRGGKEVEVIEKKKWYLSKTVWFNALALTALMIQAVTGEPWLDVEVQGAVLVIVNLVLRIVTGKPLEK